jgi:3-hydroxyacyl-CoA dehydrogenase
VMKTPNADVLPVIQETFELIALAQVAASAWEGKDMGFFAPDALIEMNQDHLLGTAKLRALQLVASGARPPEVEKIYAAGRDTYYAALMSIRGLEWGGYASEHDALIARKLAYILCGGDISAPAWVDPWIILDLEREAFLSLLGEPKTIERMMHMLQTGKPLRN